MEPSNAPVPIVMALGWVKKKASGASRKDLEDFEVGLRKIALDLSPKRLPETGAKIFPRGPVMPKKLDPLNKKNYTAVTAALCVTDVKPPLLFIRRPLVSRSAES